jgi:hypothetical protein
MAACHQNAFKGPVSIIRWPLFALLLAQVSNKSGSVHLHCLLEPRPASPAVDGLLLGAHEIEASQKLTQSLATTNLQIENL